MNDHENRQDEDAASRIVRKGVDRGEHPRSHQEGPNQRQREGKDRQQDGPDFERTALFHHHGGMQQRCAGKPRHQRGIFDRIPEPEAAPAQHVIGPVRAAGDPERQAHPGAEHPRPHPARPGGVDAAFQQRRNREREGDREADIAEIKQRRMKGEARVLQDGIEVAALERRVGNAHERIRRGENEKIEGGGNPGLHRERIGLELRRQIVAEGRHQRAEQSQDEDPQHHGAFVVSPDAGEPVQQRHRRMRIVVDVEHREVGRDVAGGKRAERDRHKGELRQRRRRRDAHEHRVVAARADDRHRALDQSKPQRQH